MADSTPQGAPGVEARSTLISIEHRSNRGALAALAQVSSTMYMRRMSGTIVLANWTPPICGE